MWIVLYVLYITIAGCSSDQQRQADDRYHMNGVSSNNSPPWPVPNIHNGKMFAIPTELKPNDVITIKGNMIDGLLDITLSSDFNKSNILCQMNVVYPENQVHDQLILRNDNNDVVTEFPATDLFVDTSFDVSFLILPQQIGVQIEQSTVGYVNLNNISDIRFISVNGEVKELIFKFSPT